MIKIDIPLTAPATTPARAAAIASTLQTLRAKSVGTISSEDLAPHWKHFKYALWLAQHKKCGFCEQQINEQDSQVEHYRPKSRLTSANGATNGYWWLAYEWKNLIVLCGTCNRQKAITFPLINEQDRVFTETALDANGNLGAERPILINPRLENPEEYFEYDISKCLQVGEVYIKGRDSDTHQAQRGNVTKTVLDLNRERVNRKRDRDNLPGKRARKLSEIRKLCDDVVFYQKLLASLQSKVLVLAATELVPAVQSQIAQVEADLAVTKSRIEAAKGPGDEFAGLVRWYTHLRQ